MFEDLMASQDIADRIGVTRATVYRYRARGDLPDPDAHIGRTPVWRSATIEAWIATRRGHGWRKGQTTR